MRTSCHWPSVNAMVFGLGLCLALSATTPTTSHAIPSDGTYMIDSDGFTGTFTVAAQALTDWSITDPFGFIWADELGNVQLNNNQFFEQNQPGNTPKLEVTWFFSASSWQAISDTSNGPPRVASTSNIGYTPVTAVPEPSGMALVGLGLGLLALVDYVRRKRRQAGMQVG